MEQFLNIISEKVNNYRSMLAAEGMSEEAIKEKATEHFNKIALDYYTKIMGLMTESDYQTYKRAVDQKDVNGLQEVLLKYRDGIMQLQQELVASL